MGETRLSQELLNTVAEIASKTAISFYKEETKKAEEQKKQNRIKDVKRQLKGYRRVKKSLEEYKEFTDEEKAEYRWKFVEDLMGNAGNYASKSERIITDEEKRRQENIYLLYRIDNALKLYREECELSRSEEDMRRYRILYSIHIDSNVSSVEEVAKLENVSEKTVYRDLGIAYRILAIYLYGT